jgi:hypothetical protein
MRRPLHSTTLTSSRPRFFFRAAAQLMQLQGGDDEALRS